MAATNRLFLHEKQMEVYKSPCRFRVVVAGRRWGKCANAGTQVAMSDGTYKSIENIIAGDWILTINETTYALENKQVEHVLDNGMKETLQITTRTGRKLRITPNHPLLANNVWTEAKHLKVGDLIATPRATVFGDKVLPNHVVEFLAIWLAEGDHHGYTNETPEINSVMNSAAEKLNTEFVDSGYKRKAGLRWRWRGKTLRKNGAIDLLNSYGLRKSNAKSKFIPDDIFRLPKAQLSIFLNLFVACDGSVNRRSKKTWAVEIGLANERMTNQLADLFLKFGIRGQISKKVHKAKSAVTGENFVSWRFIVSDSASLQIFCEEIGAISKERQVTLALESCLASSGSSNNYLPISHDEFVEHLRYEPKDVGKFGGYNCAVARDLPEALRQGLTSWRKQTPTRISERRYATLRGYSDGHFDGFVDGDFAWDEIISIEVAGDGQTWDLMVEGNHNFIAEGMVTHNTQLAKIMLLKYARIRGRLIWYVAPSYRMAKQIMWPELLSSIPRRWIRKINETTMVVTLINGTRIELKGADNPDSLRGVGIHFLVMDEVQDITPEAWYKVLRPTLASTGGHVLFIGTPKSYNLLYELYSLGQKSDNVALRKWESWQFPTMTSPFIPPEEIEAAREDMDEKSFNQEFLASFETMSGRVYHAFDRKTHIKSCPFNPNLQIWVGQDFNIDPMSSVIFQPQENGELWAIDEIVLFGSNTEEVCDELEKRYWRYIKQLTLFPDPASQYRQHARGETDLDIFRERGFIRQKFHRKHPPVADRVNCVNRMFKAADGRVRFYVDSKCKATIASFEQTIYKKGERVIDKDADVEHSGDAAGYCIEYQYPIRKIEIAGVSI